MIVKIYTTTANNNDDNEQFFFYEREFFWLSDQTRTQGLPLTNDKMNGS